MNFAFTVWHICTFIYIAQSNNFDSCQQGHHLKNGRCVKYCENCDEGKCSNAGICLKCKTKYVLSDGSCLNFCNPKCTNGICVSPDICQCNEGYLENPKTKSCESICERSCGKNAYCSSPNECTCKRGFYGDANEACQPCCQKRCKNGQCIETNTCKCDQGFGETKRYNLESETINSGQDIYRNGNIYSIKHFTTLSEYTTFDDFDYELDPEPTSTIIGEILTKETPTVLIKFSPTLIKVTCNCDDGKIFNEESGECERQCGYCRFGDCSGERICKCWPGYYFNRFFRSCQDDRVEEAEPKKNYTNYENYCKSGTCTDAICKEGLILNVETNECEKPCGPCKYGNCWDGGICKCKADYFYNNFTGSCQHSPMQLLETINDTTANKQEPFTNCENECWRGECINGICQHQEELILDKNPNELNKLCEEKKGTCNQEKICDCFQGFVRRVRKYDEECINYCVALTSCESSQGGTIDKGNCQNGTCQCLKGFIPTLGSWFECEESFGSPESYRRILFYVLWVILFLAVVFAILLIYLECKQRCQDTKNLENVRFSNIESLSFIHQWESASQRDMDT